MGEFKGAFDDCSWCYGRGCLQCSNERKKAEKESMQPIFTTKLDSPEEIELTKRVIGREALEHAFGPDGDGIQEVKANAAIAGLLRVLRQEE